MSRRKTQMEDELAQNNANLIQSDNMYQQQLQFEDPNDDFIRQSIEMLNKKMQAEEQKISNLQQVAKDVLAKVNKVFQEAVEQLTGNKRQEPPKQPAL